MAEYGATDRVRKSAAEEYIEPARQRGESTVVIHSGVFGKSLVAKKVIPPNRFPLVCDALRSRKFLEENGVSLQHIQGPPSGKSSTVTFIYRIDPLVSAPQAPPPTTTHGDDSLFMSLRGIFKDVYKEFGGAEAVHLAERESWER